MGESYLGFAEYLQQGISEVQLIVVSARSIYDHKFSSMKQCADYTVDSYLEFGRVAGGIHLVGLEDWAYNSIIWGACPPPLPIWPWLACLYYPLEKRRCMRPLILQDESTCA